MNNKKILFITNYLVRSEVSESYSMRLKIIKASKFNFDVISGVKNNNYLSKIFTYIKLISKISFSINSKFDLIELHYLVPLGVFATMLKKITSKPMIVYIQGSDLEYLPEKHLIYKWCVGITLRNADKIIVLSNDQKEKVVRQYNIDPKNIKFLRLGPNIKNRQILSKLSSSPDKKALLFIGSSSIKGGEQFIRTFDFLPSDFLGLMVVADEKYRKALRNMVNDRNIYIFPELDHQLVLAMMGVSRMLVAPSKWETTCLAALESLLIGRPVLATRVGLIKEYLLPGKNGEFIRRDPIDIAQKVLLIDNQWDRIKATTVSESTSLANSYNFDKFNSGLDRIRERLIEEYVSHKKSV